MNAIVVILNLLVSSFAQAGTQEACTDAVMKMLDQYDNLGLAEGDSTVTDIRLSLQSSSKDPSDLAAKQINETKVHELRLSAAASRLEAVSACDLNRATYFDALKQKPFLSANQTPLPLTAAEIDEHLKGVDDLLNWLHQQMDWAIQEEKDALNSPGFSVYDGLTVKVQPKSAVDLMARIKNLQARISGYITSDEKWKNELLDWKKEAQANANFASDLEAKVQSLNLEIVSHNSTVEKYQLETNQLCEQLAQTSNDIMRLNAKTKSISDSISKAFEEYRTKKEELYLDYVSKCVDPLI